MVIWVNRTIIVRLISTAQTGYFYSTTRARLGPRLSAIKYDPTGVPVLSNALFIYADLKVFDHSETASVVCGKQKVVKEELVR